MRTPVHKLWYWLVDSLEAVWNLELLCFHSGSVGLEYNSNSASTLAHMNTAHSARCYYMSSTSWALCQRHCEHERREQQIPII